MKRRIFSAAVLSVCLCAGSASGGTYLSQASVLLKGAELEVQAMRKRTYDVKLAKTLWRIADARRETAGAMIVPKEVQRTHPHLLLCLEYYERAMFSVSEKKQSQFLLFLKKARSERSTFISLLQADGWQLPN